MTRAFGNAEHKRHVISEPECREIKLTPKDDLLVLASDGLYHSMSLQQVVQLVCKLRERKARTLGEICEEVIRECLNNARNPPNDNVTILIVDLAKYYEDY